MELLSFPSLTPAQETACLNFLATVTVLMIDQQAEDAAILIRKRAKLKLPDAIIAGTAKANMLMLLTLDQKLAVAAAAI